MRRIAHAYGVELVEFDDLYRGGFYYAVQDYFHDFSTSYGTLKEAVVDFKDTARYNMNFKESRSSVFMEQMEF